MENSKKYIPLVLRSKILKENKKYFFIIVISYYILWIILGIKANVGPQLKTDPRLYFHLPIIVYTFLAANLIIKRYIKIFNVDLYGSLNIITEESEECRKIEKASEKKEKSNIQDEILKLICNEKEKLILGLGIFAFGTIIFVSDYFISGNSGTMYGRSMFPWTHLGYWMNYFYWTFFIIPLLLSLFWLIIGMLRGFKVIWNNYELKSTSCLLEIRPILDLIYLMSSLTIIFSFLYALINVYIVMIFPMYSFYYIFVIAVVGAGLFVFIWPQLSLHNELENIKGAVLSKYYKLYEDKTDEYIDNINKNKESSEIRENINKDILVIKDMIAKAEEFDTWPYFSRIKHLIAAGLGSIILIFLQAFKII